MIRNYYWNGLTRKIDAEGLAAIVKDQKASILIPPRVYVPYKDTRSLNYFRKAADDGFVPNLKVARLPEKITPEYVKLIKNRPGILSLALREQEDGALHGVPFVVPGGRFNEMYGWDSYFEALGLLADKKTYLARSMVDNFVYEITYYGKILNANRSYYLTRSQPPFLTSMALAVYEHLPKSSENKRWLSIVMQTTIHEYRTVWMNSDRFTKTGLSRYFARQIGIPPETEPGHYDAVLEPFARRANLSIPKYTQTYNENSIQEPELDIYFMHDYAVRESGHDTSYRLDNCAANLNTVDLNALLYKYEIDIAATIQTVFDDKLVMANGEIESSAEWLLRAQDRKTCMNALMWNSERGMFFDYDYVKEEQTGYECATTFYPLWAGLATPEQVEMMLKKALPLFETPGGIVAGTEASRGIISPERPQRQWDYPFGWPPHQMLIWQGLQNYGYHKEAGRLAYRWLYMITRNAVDYNGTIPEKYDVVNRTYQVFAEYGNVGTDFEYMTKEGFGWTNASYQVGLRLLTDNQRKSLEALIPAEWLFGATSVLGEM